MSIKSEADWRGLREVGGIVRLTLEALEKHVQEGVTIHEPPAIPNAVDPSQRDVLTEGLVVAIEPIISAGSGYAAGSSRCRTRYASWQPTPTA